ncbi:hypothetical protein L3V59_25700 [Burkholderia aenigmatica]|uniref:hypothetical protein n=1 Tax=Burkholderia aenigmatica TaxID=2015348 RepID=UPI001F2D4753|nr:hypothetical protein [Burkholderia aenigmatica]UKD16302.1 hypothetical protein L3V59_25700 [Burkholderia aenigmatica]
MPLVKEKYRDRSGDEALTYLYVLDSYAPLARIDEGAPTANDAIACDTVYFSTTTFRGRWRMGGMKNNTLDSLVESIQGSVQIKRLLIDRMSREEAGEIRLNLVYIEYDFLLRRIAIEYYVRDGEYPNVEMSFGEFEVFLANLG